MSGGSIVDPHFHYSQLAILQIVIKVVKFF